MIACPVKSSEGGLPKAEFNRVKLMIVDSCLLIEDIFNHHCVKISEVAAIFNKKKASPNRRGFLTTYFY
jgi:hypothetical protein